MIVIRFLFGIGEGGFQPSSSKIIATIFPKEERGRAMSIMLTSGGIVSLIVPLLAAYLLGTIGWRMMFIIIGAIGAIIAFYIGNTFNSRKMRQLQLEQKILRTK